MVSPELRIPYNGEHIWAWYFELANGVARITNGVCKPISWESLRAWSDITGNEVKPYEFEILRKMDLHFCAEMNIELEAFRLRQEEERNRKRK